jgi:hypothetical protein
MENQIGDVYSLAIKGAAKLEKEVIVDLFSPVSVVAEYYFGLPATASNTQNWDFPFFALYKFILSDDIDQEYLELFALLGCISNEEDFNKFKMEYYRLFGLDREFMSDPSLSYAGRIAQMWIQADQEEKKKLIAKWHYLMSVIRKTVTYSFFPLSSLFKREIAADPLQKSKFLIFLTADLVTKGAIPKGAHVAHKRIKDEDWFWFGLCTRNGKVCSPCSRMPGVVVYNRKHKMLRTSNIVRDVHHLSCVIHCFGTAFFGDGEAFVTMNKKIMKMFNLWGAQRLLGDNKGEGRPELVSMAYSLYETKDTKAICGNGLDGVMTIKESQEAGHVHYARFNMSMHDSRGLICRKEFTVFSGNMIEFERGCEEERIINWLVDVKLLKTGKERDSENVYCGDIRKRVNWMKSTGILDRPCALWQYRELFGDYFGRIETQLRKQANKSKTDHYRLLNGASMTVVGGAADGQALWDGRVGETHYLPVEEIELILHSLTSRGREIALQLKTDAEPVKIRKVGRKRGDNVDNVNMDELISEINSRMAKGQSCNAACIAVHKKYKLTIAVKSLTRNYRRWMQLNKKK